MDNKSIRSDVLLGGDLKSHVFSCRITNKRTSTRRFVVIPVAPPPYTYTPRRGIFPPLNRATMAAVTSPETSPQPRVYFQTPAGSTEEPETPVRKQGRVTVKYDRKELRKRLNLEEWIIDQLTDLYDCEVKTANNNRPRNRSNVSTRRLC